MNPKIDSGRLSSEFNWNYPNPFTRKPTKRSIPDSEVREIRTAYEQRDQKEPIMKFCERLGKKYQLNRTSIWRIVKRENYKDVE